MSAVDRWCVGWNRNPHVPDDGLHLAVVTPHGAEVRLCRLCLRGWQAGGEDGR